MKNRAGTVFFFFVLLALAAAVYGFRFPPGVDSPFRLTAGESRFAHGTGLSGNYKTENVIILVIDGPRNQEIFEDPSHQYIPYIWNVLRPLGTIYTEMYVTTRTATTPGHLALVSGCRNNIHGTFSNVTDMFRESRPTIFESYRKAFGLAASETWVVSGKSQLSTCDYSLHPLWGPAYGAKIEFEIGHDRETVNRFYEIAQQDYPSLTLINLKDVDHIAHSPEGETFEDYTDAIITADALTDEIWRSIQADPHYSDKTTLIVTTDHGRSAEDYHDHGLPTHAERHCFFLAIGPDIKKGHEVNTRADLMDIAPTVGELLGFDMPLAEGRVLHEMLSTFDFNPAVRSQAPSGGEEIRLTTSAEGSIGPAIAADAGGLHVIWSERDGNSAAEHRLIKYRKSADLGTSWQGPEVILDDFACYSDNSPNHFPDEGLDIWQNSAGVSQGNPSNHGGTPMYASIEAVDGGPLSIAVSGYSEFKNRQGETELQWGVNLLKKTPSGPWAEQGFYNIGRFVNVAPGLTVSPSDVWAAWTDMVNNMSLGFSDKTDVRFFPPLDRTITMTGWQDPGYTPPGNPYGVYRKFYRAPDVTWHDGCLHYVFEFNDWYTGRIYYLRFDGDTYEELNMERVDDADGPSWHPRIAAENQIIYVVWDDTDPIFGKWQVKFRRSTEDEIQQLSHSAAGAWHADIAVHGAVLAVVWEDYRHGNAEIYAVKSTDGGENWGPETRITTADGFSCHPRIATFGGHFYTVWQDNRDGNWEIYFKDLEDL